jgi:diguanylate cyclase (GGDEF)-like protein
MMESPIASYLLSQKTEYQLNLSLTIGELNLYESYVELINLGKDIVNKLSEDQRLPGVLLMENGELVGMISRRRFLEIMSRPYGLELFFKRSIKTLYPFTKTDILVLPGDTLVVEAAKNSLARPPELLDEPIIVEIEPGVYRLLDIHQLLVNHSHIHEYTTNLVTQLYKKLENVNQQLQRLACLDGLTELGNRRYFDQYLQREYKRAIRDNNWISLIMGDVDFFKAYNDTYGHIAGDDCLRKIAKAIQQAMKRPADLAARYGGEEFACILPNTNVDGAVIVAKNIRENIKELHIPHRASLSSSYVTLSLGIASLKPLVNTKPSRLIETADEALYQAKQKGRDCYLVHAYEYY